MTTSDPARKLHAALKRLRTGAGDRPALATAGCPFSDADPLVHLLIESFMLWEASHAEASAAVGRLCAAVVDYNELRVCFTDELAAAVGAGYPRVDERCARMRCALNDIFRREHAVSLAHLQAPGRKDARGYLESLDGTPTFVSARVALIGLGVHAIPVDDRLVRALADAGCCQRADSCESVSTWLERQFKPGEGPEAHALLQAWSDSHLEPAPPAASTRKTKGKSSSEFKPKPARSGKSPRTKARAKE